MLDPVGAEAVAALKHTEILANCVVMMSLVGDDVISS